MAERGAKLLGHGADCELEELSSDDVLAVAAALKNATALRTLELRRIPMGLRECQAIGDGLRGAASLTALSLSRVGLEDEGASAICEALQATTGNSLATLNLCANGVGPGGARAIAALCMVKAAMTKVR